VEAQRAALEAALGRFGTALSAEQRTRLARELQALKAKALGRKAKEVFGRVVRRKA